MRANQHLRLAAVRRTGCEAADAGLLSPELVAGIRRVKVVRLNSRPLCAQIAEPVQRARLLLGIVRARSSPPLVSAGRTGVLGQFFALLGKSEDVTDTPAFRPLGDCFRIGSSRRIWCVWHIRSAEAEDVTLTGLVAYRLDVLIVDGLLLIETGHGPSCDLEFVCALPGGVWWRLKHGERSTTWTLLRSMAKSSSAFRVHAVAMELRLRCLLAVVAAVLLTNGYLAGTGGMGAIVLIGLCVRHVVALKNLSNARRAAHGDFTGSA